MSKQLAFPVLCWRMLQLLEGCLPHASTHNKPHYEGRVGPVCVCVCAVVLMWQQ